eukprot:782163-Prymnesium_polylepis.1
MHGAPATLPISASRMVQTAIPPTVAARAMPFRTAHATAISKAATEHRIESGIIMRPSAGFGTSMRSSVI